MKDLKSNTEWKQWGREDPFWAVSSWANKQKHGSSPWTEQEFYALGESDCQDFIRQWQHYGIEKESCIEIGCGAGRLTKQLAKIFRQVYAVDVSEDMIAHARKAVGPNVEFSLIDGLRLPQHDGFVTSVFSALVLQHLDNAETGLSYFQEFYRVLGPGGTLMIQLPIYQFPNYPAPARIIIQMLHAFTRTVGSIHADMRRRAGIKLMRMTPYSMDSLCNRLVDIGFGQVEFRVFPTKSNGVLHSFVFATKTG